MTYEEFMMEYNKLELQRAMCVSNKRKYKEATAKTAALIRNNPECVAEMVAYQERMNRNLIKR